MIFDAINLLKSELKEVFPYKVLEVPGAEADDIIATLCKWSQLNDLKEGSLIVEPKPVLIISGDHDFFQLQKYPNVHQFSPVKKKFIKEDRSPHAVLIGHIIKGDKGDGIPNVLSADDVIINGERQKPISSKKLSEWVQDPSSMPTDVIFQRNYDRNRTLIDLDLIPKNIEDNILNTFNTYKNNDKSLVLDFFIKNKMKHMIEFIEEF